MSPGETALSGWAVSSGRVDILWDFMPNFHVVMNWATDLDAIERRAAEGQAPRHSLPILARRLGGTLHQAMRNPPPPSLADRARSKLIGMPGSWSFARDFASQLGSDDVVYCLDEIIGVPLASVLRRRKSNRPKLVVFLVNIVRPRGKLALKLLRMVDAVDLFVAACTTQFDFLRDEWKVSDDRMFLQLEHLDNRFYTPGPATPGKTRPMIAAAGMEKRDYRTLAAATQDLDVDVKVGAWSPIATSLAKTFPPELPANMTRSRYQPTELVQLYRDADIVAASLFPANYAAGITSMMEGLACGRPVVVTRSPGLSDYLSPSDGLSVVEPGDPAAMRAAIVKLLENPAAAEAQGRQGLELATRRYDFDRSVETIATRLEAL